MGGIYEPGAAASEAIGSVKPHAAAAGPENHLKCDGAAISRTTYSALFAVIGTAFGVGDGATTFNVPDLRGEFIRGFDDGAGVDSGRAFATNQAETLMATRVVAGWSINAMNGDSSLVSGTVARHSGTTSEPVSATYVGVRPRNVAMSYWIKF